MPSFQRESVLALLSRVRALKSRRVWSISGAASVVCLVVFRVSCVWSKESRWARLRRQTREGLRVVWGSSNPQSLRCSQFFFVNILFIIFLLHLLSCCWLLQTLICSRLFFNYYVLCLYFFGRQKYCCIILDFTTILNTYYTAFHLLVCGLLGFFLSFLLFYTS